MASIAQGAILSASLKGNSPGEVLSPCTETFNALKIITHISCRVILFKGAKVSADIPLTIPKE